MKRANFFLTWNVWCVVAAKGEHSWWATPLWIMAMGHMTIATAYFWIARNTDL